MFEKILKEIKEYALTVVIALLFTTTFNTFFGLTSVNGESMYPTLNTGNKLIINKVAKMKNDINRGDIVVFDTTPDNPKKEKVFYVKRVIAKGGDTVKIFNGNVYVNGKKIKEDYADKENFSDELDETVISDNCYFVLGDHRDNSYDSRNFGEIEHKQVVGKAVLQILPSINTKKFTTPTS